VHYELLYMLDMLDTWVKSICNGHLY